MLRPKTARRLAAGLVLAAAGTYLGPGWTVVSIIILIIAIILIILAKMATAPILPRTLIWDPNDGWTPVEPRRPE